MKIIIFAIALFAGIPFLSIAQNTKQAPKTDKVDPVQYAERLAREMQRAINLNEDQYRQVFDLNMRSYNEIQEAKNVDGKSSERINAIRNAKDEELKRILTPEQFKQMLEWKKNKKEDAAVEYNQKMTEKKAEKVKAKTTK